MEEERFGNLRKALGGWLAAHTSARRGVRREERIAVYRLFVTLGDTILQGVSFWWWEIVTSKYTHER